MIGVNQLPDSLKSTVADMTGANVAANPLMGASSPVPDAASPAPANDLGGTSALSGPQVAPITQVPTANLTFGQKVAQAAEKLGIPPGPGGWAKSLVGAAQTALSGLGDIDTSPGGGALAGVAGTMKNHAERVRQQQLDQQKQAQQAIDNKRADTAQGLEKRKADAMIAHENASMVHEQALTHQLDEADVQRSIGEGTKLYASLTTGENPAPVLAKDLTSNELQTQIAQGKISATAAHAYPTGTKQVGEDKDGKPIMQTTYSVVGDVPSKKVDESTAAYINKYLPDTNIKAGQELTGAQFGTLTQQAASVAAATAARNKTLTDAEIVSKTDAQKLEAVNLGPEWNNALANAKNDPFKALKTLEADPKARAKYPNLAQDVMGAYGGPKEWETMRGDRVKEAQKQQELDQAKFDEAGAIMTDDVKAKLSALPPDRRKVVEQYPHEAGSLMAVALGPGDVDFHQIFPVRLTKGAPGINAQTAINAIRAINPNWSEQQYTATHNAYKDITQGKSGIQVAQYNNVLKHAATLQDTINEATGRANNPRFLNTALNAMGTQGWGAEATKINTEVNAVKGEYELLMNAGYKPSDVEQKIYNDIITGAATPAQIGAFSKAVGSTGAVRLESINDHQYKVISGQNFPGILEQDTMDAAKHLNLDAETMKRLNKLDVGGTLFHNPNWKAPTEVEVQQKSVDEDQQKIAQQAGAVAALPPKAVSQLKEGAHTKFANGQTWTLQNGKPVQVQQ